MKKLLTIMASLATAFAFGAGNAEDAFVPTGTSFEEEQYVAGNPFVTSVTEGGSLYWRAAAGAEIGVISNYEQAAAVDVPIASRPLMFASSPNEQFLSLDTSAPLFRSVVPNKQDGSFDGVAIPTDGIYLDTLVQFTAADTAFGEDGLATGDKIAISYVEHESEGEDDPAFTNFVVRAGYVNGSGVLATNYFCDVQADFDKTAWHRLTVRTLADTGDGVAKLGFVVYLDGVALTYSADVAAGDATFEGALNTVAQRFYGSESRSLFPSAVTADSTGGETISAASFSGTGAIDDVSFTDMKPSFISESTVITIAWDANVSRISTSGAVSDLSEYPCGGVAGSTTVTLPAGSGTLTITATYANGYEAGVWTVTGTGSYSTEGIFTGLADGAKCNIVSMMPLFDVNGTHFAGNEFAAALAEAMKIGEPLKLLADYTGSLLIDDDGSDVVIDLAGKTLKGTDIATIMVADANVMITNSTTEIGHIVPADVVPDELDEVFAVLLGGGKVKITAGYIDGMIDADGGDLDTDLALTGGYYLDEEAVVAEDFYLCEYDCVKAPVSIVGNGYVLVGGEPVTPTDFSVFVAPAVAHSSVTVATEAGEQIEGIDNVYTADWGKTIVVTYTADTGWKFVAGATTTKSFTSSDSTTFATAPAVVEDVPVVTTFTLTLTGLDDANATVSVNDADAVETYELDTTLVFVVTPEENYEYASAPEGWTLTDGGAITRTYTDQAEDLTVAIPAATPKQVEPTTYYVQTYTNGVAYIQEEYELNAATLTLTDPVYDTETEDWDGKWYTTADGNTEFVFDGTVEGNTQVAYAKITAKVVPPTPSDWDIPGAEGGINAIVDPETSEKSVEFTSIEIADGKIKVGLKAAKINANGQTFGLICKTDLTKDKTITINVTLTDDESGEATLADLAGETGETQLFVVGIGPKAEEN